MVSGTTRAKAWWRRNGYEVWSVFRLTVALTVLMVVVLPLLSACSSSARPGPVVTVTAEAETTGEDPLRPAPTDALEVLDDGTVVAPEPVSTLVLDEGSRVAAAAHAAAVMTAFAATPGENAQQWWAQLSPLMSQTGREVYEFVDPANVPVTKVTGTAAVEPAASARVARVKVPTDAGEYVVVLVRSDESPAWAADRLIAPSAVPN